VKKAFFPLLSLVFVITCAAFVFFLRDSSPTYVHVAAPAVSVGADDPVRPSIGAPSVTGNPVRAQNTLVNINTASLAELMTLHGIGEVMGQRIIDYREGSGSFMAVEEIMDVSGIGERTFENIRDRITV